MTSTRNRWVRLVAVSVTLLAAAETVWGQQAYVYPTKGQSPQQQEFDRGQCYSWAVQQTGFDPANPRVATGPAPAMQAPQGGMFRGAAGGAALVVAGFRIYARF